MKIYNNKNDFYETYKLSDLLMIDYDEGKCSELIERLNPIYMLSCCILKMILFQENTSRKKKMSKFLSW